MEEVWRWYEKVQLVLAQESLSCGLVVAKLLEKKYHRKVSLKWQLYLPAVSLNCWSLFPLTLSTLVVHQ